MGIQLEIKDIDHRSCDLSDWQSQVEKLSAHNEQLLLEVRRLEDLCDQDAALPVLNRRGLQRALSAEIARANRYQVVSSFIYIDIDEFKTINDRHGHGQGDAILQYLTDHIKRRLRNTDSFARLGGDEFAIVMSHTTLAQARHKVDLLAHSVSKACKSWGPGAENFSFSAGVSEIKDGQQPDEIIAHADENMYLDKANKPEKRR